MQARGQNRPTVTAAAFGAKFRSKREIFKFLTIDVNAYLCDCDNLTIYFLKDIMTGKKRQ